MTRNPRSKASKAAVVMAVGIAAVVASVAIPATSSSANLGKRVIISVTPVRPYQQGDLLWTSSAPPVTQFATGCQRVPSTGYLNTNAYAQTVAEYANRWDWSSGSANQSFDWWIKKTDGTVQASGSSGGAGGGRTLPANVYYWRVQNQGGSPQAWNVCYDVL